MSLVTHLDHRERRVAQRRDQPELVDRQPHDGGDVIDRMRADHEAHRQRLSGRGARLVDRPQVARRDEIDAGLAAAAQHQPAHADIGPAGLRIDDVSRSRPRCRARRRRRAADAPAAWSDRRRRRSARPAAPAPRRARPRRSSGLLRSRRCTSAQQLVRLDPERAGEPRAAAGDVADQFLAFGADRAEQHRLGIAFERCPRRRRDPSPRLRSRGHRRQPFDEAAQAEAVEIGQP